MGTKFGDLTQYLDDSLTLPIDGIEYRIPGPSAEVGLMCQELFAAGAMFKMAEADPTLAQADGGISSATRRVLLEGDDEVNFYAKVLTKAVYDQMIADGVSFQRIKRAGTTVFLWVAVSLQVAENFWQYGVVSLDPLAQTAPANRAARRSTRTRTASAAKPASPSGTKSRQTSRTNSASAAPRSRGSKS